MALCESSRSVCDDECVLIPSFLLEVLGPNFLNQKQEDAVSGVDQLIIRRR